MRLSAPRKILVRRLHYEEKGRQDNDSRVAECTDHFNIDQEPQSSSSPSTLSSLSVGVFSYLTYSA